MDAKIRLESLSKPRGCGFQPQQSRRKLGQDAPATISKPVLKGPLENVKTPSDWSIQLRSPLGTLATTFAELLRFAI